MSAHSVAPSCRRCRVDLVEEHRLAAADGSDRGCRASTARASATRPKEKLPSSDGCEHHLVHPVRPGSRAWSSPNSPSPRPTPRRLPAAASATPTAAPRASSADRAASRFSASAGARPSPRRRAAGSSPVAPPAGRARLARFQEAPRSSTSYSAFERRDLVDDTSTCRPQARPAAIPRTHGSWTASRRRTASRGDAARRGSVPLLESGRAARAAIRSSRRRRRQATGVGAPSTGRRRRSRPLALVAQLRTLAGLEA